MWHQQPNDLGRRFDLGPDELWLLEHIYPHASGIYSPPISEIVAAARAAGIRITKERAYAASKALQTKGYLQMLDFTWQQVKYHFRSVTKVAHQFEVDLNIVDHDWLVEQSRAFNLERRRPDVVEKTKRERAVQEREGATVVDINEHRRKTA
jgi:arginyl-tRNA synthetase